MKAVALACAFALLCPPAWAASEQPKPKPICSSLDHTKALFPEGTEFTKLTPGQYNFARGVYARDPNTQPGLPPGTYALLAKPKGEKDGALLWIDGDKSCNPMLAQEVLIDLLNEVVTGKTDASGDEM